MVANKFQVFPGVDTETLNVADLTFGLGVSATITRDDKTGKLQSAALNAIRMGQSGEQTVIDRLDIQRAQSAVLVEQGGVEYAIVADDNYSFNDPLYMAQFEAPDFIFTPDGPPLAVGGSVDAKKVAVGGKLGIVKDPFGLHGSPQYLGATLPLDGYGIQNLSVSPDGKVLLGQLMGGFSARDTWSKQLPHQSGAWNVAQIIQAALAHPEADRLKKHIKLPTGAEQLIPQLSSQVPAGTVFDFNEPLTFKTGNMGDIVSLSLLDAAIDAEARRQGWGAREAGPDGKPQEPIPLPDVPPELMTAEARARYNQNRALLLLNFQQDFSDFHINVDDIDKLISPTSEMKLVTRANQGDGAKVPLSRTANEKADANYQESGMLYFAPNLTMDDMTKLRKGEKLGEKESVFKFTYRFGTFLNTAKVSISAKDATHGVFFGDRPLDNPGYSEMHLHGSVGAQQTNNRLDVMRVEQRLKYLGYYKSRLGGLNIPEIEVNGTLDAGETNSLIVFYAQTHNSGTEGGFPNFADNNSAKTVGVTPSSAPESLGNLDWLNAYNAPHLINVREGLNYPVGGTSPDNRFRDADPGSANNQRESFSSSWIYDLLQAWRQVQDTLNLVPAELRRAINTPSLSISSLSAPNRMPPAQHANSKHGLNMALDISIGDFVSVRNQRRTGDNTPENPLQGLGTGWSVANAINWSGRLNQNSNNDGTYNLQAAARYFLSLYALTVRDDVQNTGDWSEIQIANGGNDDEKLAIKRALFGSGAQADSVIMHAFFGNAGGTPEGQTEYPVKNTYPSVRQVLTQLGIQVSTEKHFHESHYHIDFKPPTWTKIDLAPANLEAVDLLAQDPISGTIGDESMKLSTALSAGFLVASLSQVSEASEKYPRIDPIQVNARTIGTCEFYDPTRASEIAFSQLTPAGAVDLYAQIYQKAALRSSDPSDYSISFLEPPKYGRIQRVISDGQVAYQYVPNEGYMGNDKYIAEVKSQGVVFRVVGYIIPTLDHITGADVLCKRQGFPEYVWKISDASGADTFNDTPVEFSGVLSGLNQLPLAVSNLAGNGLAQTTWSGTTASIMVDSSAAGHGWYFDPTPLDNTDDFLPTADPTVWQAKPGSEADGHMDMLSVLLHEYGHVLGLAHSDDVRDFMGPSLAAGQRRLPTDAQLQLMAKLAATLNQAADNAPTPWQPMCRH